MDDNEIGIGPHVRCAATVKNPSEPASLFNPPILECARSPIDGHTTHATVNEYVVWTGWIQMKRRAKA